MNAEDLDRMLWKQAFILYGFRAVPWDGQWVIVTPDRMEGYLAQPEERRRYVPARRVKGRYKGDPRRYIPGMGNENDIYAMAQMILGDRCGRFYITGEKGRRALGFSHGGPYAHAGDKVVQG